MGSDQPVDQRVCQGCGQPLAGRDRYERLCAACREAQALRQPLPPEPAGEAAREVDCPACGAVNPPGANTCAHCGASLRGRSRIRLGLAIAAGTLAVVAAAWLVFLRPREQATPPRPQVGAPPPPAPPKPPSPPEPAPSPAPATPKPVPPDVAAAVQQETREFLAFLATGNYDRVIDNYVQPDEVEFARVARALDDLVSGSGAKGMAEWGSRRIRHGQASLVADLERAGDPRPAFTAELLAFLAKEPEASDPRKTPEDRARAILRWHLKGLFEGLEVASAELGTTSEVRPAEAAVALRCRGERRAAWLRAEPIQLVWRRLPVGWVVRLGLAEWLERSRDVLKRPLAEPRATPPGATP